MNGKEDERTQHNIRVEHTHTHKEIQAHRGSKPVGECDRVHLMFIDGSVISFSVFRSTLRQSRASNNEASTKRRFNQNICSKKNQKGDFIMCLYTYILMGVCECECTRSRFSLFLSFLFDGILRPLVHVQHNAPLY